MKFSEEHLSDVPNKCLTPIDICEIEFNLQDLDEVPREKLEHCPCVELDLTKCLVRGAC